MRKLPRHPRCRGSTSQRHGQTTQDDSILSSNPLNQTRRIAIHCVSLGRDSELLERLAQENGGRYVRR